MTARPDALEVLLRLERRRLDEARAAVRAVDSQREAAIERRDRGRARVAQERQVGSTHPEFAPWFATYLEAARIEASALEVELARLAEDHRSAVDRALARRLECRRLELLAARARAKARSAETRLQERRLEELLPHLRSGSPAGH